MLLFVLERKFNSQPYLELLFKTVFLLACYGMMRIGELVKSKAEHAVRACYVHVADNKNKILLILFTSKTHDETNEPQHIKISACQ